MVSDDQIQEIHSFVQFCSNNVKTLDEYDKMLLECKLNQNLNVFVANGAAAAAATANANTVDKNTTATANRECHINNVLDKNTEKIENWDKLIKESKEHDKITSYMNYIEYTTDKNLKKKHVNNFLIAKKKYSKRFTQDPKHEHLSVLEFDCYAEA